MARANRRDNDINTVELLYSKTAMHDFNRQQPDRSSCVESACANGHDDIDQILLEYRASCQLQDYEAPTSFGPGKTTDMHKLSSPPEEEKVATRLNVNSNSSLQWVYDKHIAHYFGRAFRWGCIKDRGIKKTVKKIRDAHIVSNDQSKAAKLYEYYLNQALEKNDPTYLLRLYTIEGPFYKRLNSYLAEGGKKKVFKKICGKWSGYFIGMVVLNPVFLSYHSSGITYRGIEITRNEMQQYKEGAIIANKAFQSTSKSRDVVYPFAHREKPAPGTFPAVITYKIVDKRSAIDISSLSEFPEEQEVLIVPGTCFQVVYVDQNDIECQFHLVQLQWDDS